ncbi:MAG: right-handed parallel beta-helix repeat-containing protein, partial [Planctomycetota bacterium]
MLTRRTVQIALAITATTATATAQTTLYVDDDASPGGNGLTWASAYRFLQDALADAAGSGGAVTEIHVAQGAYTPDLDELGNVTPLDREATFRLLNGVAAEGGYAGLSNPGDPDARDVDLYETMLSGDLLGDDGPPGSFTNTADNAYNVVTGSGTDATALLDGFTITGGNADGPDGGELNWTRGGGMWSLTGSPTVTDCTIAYNYARQAGGGIYNRQNSSPTITDCLIEGNVVEDGLGGGMANAFDSSPTVVGCDFIANTAGSGGGGLVNGFNSLPTFVTDCRFVNNSIAQMDYPSAGGGMGGLEADAIVSGCIFMGNTAREGGGMVFEDSTVAITDCQFIDNTAAFGGAIELFSNSNATLVNCLMAGNAVATGGDGFGGHGGAVYTHTSQSSLVNCT